MEETFKFELGQWVRVTCRNAVPWTGRVYRRNHFLGVAEYWVTGAPPASKGVDPASYPMLAWENEMVAVDPPVAANE